MFDTIIVGAGSAGCVLAARLSEDPHCRVLLLEAGGPDRRKEIHIPAAFAGLFRTEVDWDNWTEEQPHLKGRKLYWPRGKVLGGCSSINAMITIRGHPGDYDHWRDLGNEGWSFADVLPYFKKSEDQERGASEVHGVGGPLSVSDLRTVHPLTHCFLEAGLQLGLEPNDDFNGPRQEGVGLYQVTQKRGKRLSAAGAYLHPARKRKNLTVQTHAQTTRVLFEGDRAIGVEVLQDGQRHKLLAGREVILCAGAVCSPQLLLISGVGPAAALEGLGIEVRVDLPGVGRNLQDHLIAGTSCFCTKPISLSRAESLLNYLKLLLLGRGPLTSNVAEGGAFVKTHPEKALPDIQVLFAPAFFVNHGFSRPGDDGFSIGAVLLRPESVGEITLRSADPLAPPVIQPRYLESERDLQALVEGVKLVRRLAQAPAFDPYRGEEYLPGKGVQTDADLAHYVRQYVETLYHPVGTCKMGSDADAVVDAQLGVHGTRGLRVVDASIMPRIVGGNTNAPVIMIAEKAADLIRGRSV